MSKLRTLSASLLLTVSTIPSVAVAQERGEVAGQVTAAESGAPLSGAQVRINGTTRQTLTDASGRYRIAAVAPGSYTLNVSIIGRSAGTRPVTVAAGQTVTANFSLATSAIALEGVVVNAVTGRRSAAARRAPTRRTSTSVTSTRAPSPRWRTSLPAAPRA